ncbi:hypothetical protein N7539_008453 [Penicillium diatomitis]|uniref:DUF4219 domain-containing protein n=1 Tax=Penicillium diatomitis TaxID=2819901 RepID=A0A9W9WUL4_9EURO|nr:uncharacterized protein N7539_008453 [Penicillium diatomitis]KAJ5475387.1 hypothetical protein N7539_008453 [Penicillium diatomitis]
MGEFQDAVPKLKGVSNFRNWQTSLEHYLNYRNPGMWAVMTGAHVPETNNPLPTPGEEEVRLHISAEHDITPEDVTSSQIREWLQVNILQKNEEFATWHKLNAGCLFYLSASLAESIKACIRKFKVASEAYEEICSFWKLESSLAFPERYRKWVTCHYRQGGKARVFVHKWKKCLQEVQEVSPDLLPPAWQYGQFLQAIRSHPEAELLVTHHKPDLESPRILQDVISKFLSLG